MSVFVKKQLLTDLFQICWLNISYVESCRKLPRKLGYFFLFRKPKPCPFGTLFLMFLIILFLGSFCLCLMFGVVRAAPTPLPQLPWDWSRPMRLGIGWGKILILICLKRVPIKSFLKDFFKISIDLCFPLLFS